MILRLLKTVLGLALVTVGGLLLVAPGPGVPLIALGSALVLSQSAPGRRALARIRLWARDRFGSSRVRELERRLPREVVQQDTTQMRLDLDEHARRRRRSRS